MPVFFKKPGPTTRKKQPVIGDPDRCNAVRKKILKVIKWRYVVRTSVPVKSLIKFFDFPKGKRDIQLVYDTTANALNECVWVPSFWLPTIDSVLRAMDSDSWMADRDIGDMFLNFQLHHSVQQFTSLDLSHILNPDDETAVDDNTHTENFYLWDRNLMGFKPSLYNSIKMALEAEEVVKSDRHDNQNPFQWKKIKTNLPSTTSYTPTKSWIFKICSDGLMVCDLFTFVDDERITGPTCELTWQASHTLAAKQSYLRIQDAAWKVRPCGQQIGAWAGSVVYVVAQKGVCVLTSDKKWKKLKLILEKWHDRLISGEEQLSHKELLSDHGFLMYVTQMYPALIPYLKGFHLTVEFWQGGQDEQGWKLKQELSDTQDVILTKEVEEDEHWEKVESEDEDLAASNHRLARQGAREVLYSPLSGTDSLRTLWL